MADKLTTLEKFQQDIPLVREIHLPMVADSTAEVAVEIDTDLAPGTKFGWQMYGMRWSYRTIASPYNIVDPEDTSGTGAEIMVQLCRGEAPATPVRLAPGDNDLIMEDTFSIVLATAVGFIDREWPRAVSAPATTQLPTLYLMHVTEADIAPISDAGVELYVELLYNVVDGPKVPLEVQ